MTRRSLVSAAVVLTAIVGVLAVRRLNADQEFRQLLTEGEGFLDTRQTARAVDAFTQAIAIRPTAMVGHYRRGEAYADAGRHDLALKDLTEARRLAPEAPQPLEALGRLADKRGQPAEAAEWYAQAVDRTRSADVRLLYALALARYRAGSPATARAPLKTALTRDDRLAEAHYLLGLIAADTNEFDEAQAALEHAVRLDSRLLAAREELADLYRRRGRTADELLQLRALAAVDPRIERYLALADAAARAERFSDAEAAVTQAEAVDATDPRVAVALGRLHLTRAERTGDRRELPLALAVLRRTLDATRTSEALALYGRALFLSGDLREAERVLKDAILLSPAEPRAFVFLTDAAERLGNLDVALDALIKVDLLAGDTANADERADRARRIGGLAVRAGQASRALPYLEAAVKAGIVDGATFTLLAEARLAGGDDTGALQALTAAAEADGETAEIRRLRRTIR